jgi:hypothetical protein
MSLRLCGFALACVLCFSLILSGQTTTGTITETVTDPSDTNTMGGRPDVVPGVSTDIAGGRSMNLYFNPAAFSVPGCPLTDPVCTNPAPVGRFGNAGMGTVRGVPIWNADLAFSKYFTITEHLRAQFRANFANVFNHQNSRCLLLISVRRQLSVASPPPCPRPSVPSGRAISTSNCVWSSNRGPI